MSTMEKLSSGALNNSAVPDPERPALIVEKPIGDVTRGNGDDPSYAGFGR